MAFLGQSGVGPFHPKLQVPRPMLYLDLCFPCREKYKPLGFLCLRVIGSGEKKLVLLFVAPGTAFYQKSIHWGLAGSKIRTWRVNLIFKVA